MKRVPEPLITVIVLIFAFIEVGNGQIRKDGVLDTNRVKAVFTNQGSFGNPQVRAMAFEWPEANGLTYAMFMIRME